jgi:molybdopterin-guanine dinucleotide biosynthesis protein A
MSSRFGRDKATFDLNGEMLAARAARVCEEVFPDNAARFVSSVCCKFLDREMIADIYPARGAAGAIHAALADAPTSWIFILACDLPLVSADLIKKLSDSAEPGNGCIIPVQPDGRWQPLCGLYEVVRALPLLQASISGDGPYPSLRSTAEGLSPRIVEFVEYSELSDAPELLINLNTLADLERI